eukprot:3102677-Rhodomonas_salina.1
MEKKSLWLRKSSHTGAVADGRNTWSAGPHTGQKMMNGSPNITSPTLKRYLTRTSLDRRKNLPHQHGPHVVSRLYAVSDDWVTFGTMRDHSSIREGGN